MEEYWNQAYKDKRFSNEIDDVRRVYTSVLADTKLNVKIIFVVGFSLGGTLALLLASEFPQIQKICTIGSAISTKRGNLPVLSGYPEKKDILSTLTSFRGSLHMFQGYDEQVVPFHDPIEVFEQIQNTHYLSLTRVAGANHMFSGKDSQGFWEQKFLFQEILHFLKIP